MMIAMSYQLQIRITDAARAKTDLVFFIGEGEFVYRPIPETEFSGKKGTWSVFHEPDRREIFVGVGSLSNAIDLPGSLREASGIAMRQLTKTGSTRISIDVSQYLDRVDPILEGVWIAAYEYDTFKESKSGKKPRIVELVAPRKAHTLLRKLARRSRAIGEATHWIRTIGNHPGNLVQPDTLANEARQLAKSSALSIKVWNRTLLEKEGFGGILAVGGGSVHEPRLIQLKWDSTRHKVPHIVLVGKAISFDSGGISIKPSDGMEEMKFDKMGGCAVLGIMRALTQLKLPCRVTALLAAAENMPDGKAYRPGDVITSYDGQTIEVINTDAEGRVVMADALAYARMKLKPDLLLDMATLTGACVVALGEERAGLFTKVPALEDLMRKAGDETGEKVWPLPLGDEFDDAIESPIAHVRNTGNTRWGGASTAAAFLQKWTKDTPHIHLDIAGPSMSVKESASRAAGTSGFGVRLVVRFLEKFISEQQDKS